MKTILFVPTATVNGIKPSPWFEKRLTAAINYFRENTSEECIFIISGRWKDTTSSFELSEAEVGKRFILSKLPVAEILKEEISVNTPSNFAFSKPMSKLPGTKILKEEISVNTPSNFAFSKPIILAYQPDKVVVFNTKIMQDRTKWCAEKIWGQDLKYEFVFTEDELCFNERAVQKEPKAVKMFQRLLEHIPMGDDKSVRETLLYKAPFYFRDFIDSKKFFDEYWEGGFEDYLDKSLSKDNK